MAISTGILKPLLELELAGICDNRVTTHIRSLLVEPKPVLRDWDYGATGQQFVCWNVLEHPSSNTGIAYCESGFGPGAPWGLVALEGAHMSIGMDSGWFQTFLRAYLDSQPATLLPIWRVYKTDLSGVRLPITSEGEWDQTWQQVMHYRAVDFASHYDCDTSIE
jgi:hypothetical protein